jgi:SNF2 family DNA or RNA helicase
MAFCENLDGSMLAMDMGTGKSRVGVELSELWESKSILILCPKAVIAAWDKQFRLYSNRDFGIACLDKGTIAARQEQAEKVAAVAKVKGQPFIVVINYDAVWRSPMAQWIQSQTWDLVITDESHRIKAPGGKASMFCMRLRALARRRLCFTGTPMPHSPLDLYAQFRFIDPSIFGTSFMRFRSRYAVMGGYQGHQVMGWQEEQEMHDKMYSRAFRVSNDVLDLPPVMHETRTCELSPKARRIYKGLFDEFVAEVDEGTITVTNALTKLLRLAQVTSGHLRLDSPDDETPGEVVEIDSAKRDLFADMLVDMPEHEPLVVFCRFHHDLDAIKAVATAQGRSCGELSGRRNQLAQWQAGDTSVLAVQIDSGGEGIDLTRARIAIYYSVGFSLGRYNQSLARLHRPGQQGSVMYYHLITEDTVDADIYKALADKEQVIERILRTIRGGDNINDDNIEQAI